LVVALVAGLLGVFGTALGGVVGGVVSNKGAERLQEQAAHRADQQRSRAVRAAARLLTSDLVSVRSNALAAARDQRWDPANYQIAVSYQDRNLLAAEMRGDDWTTLSDALVTISEFYAVRHRYIDTEFDYSKGGQSSDMDYAILIADSTAKAIPALARLGGVDLETSGLKVFISRDYEPKPMRHYRSTR